MPSVRSTKAKRASTTDAAQLRADVGRADEMREAAGVPEQRAALKEAMAKQNVRASRSPGAIGPVGRTLLMITLITLIGLIAVWVLLAL